MTRDTPRKRRVDTRTDASEDEPPADRSVRKRVARRRIERNLAESSSDEAASGDEVAAEAGLWDDDDEEESSSNDDDPPAAAAAGADEAQTPSATTTTTPRRRGRPPNPNKPARAKKGTRREEEDALASLHLLPAHERYFWDNRPGARAQSSANTLPPGLLLDRDGYFAAGAALRAKRGGGGHAREREFLLGLHRRAFPQWAFEMDAGFGVLLYGYGSKRAVVRAFAEHLHAASERPPTVVVVNGFAPGLTLSDVLITVAGALLPAHARPAATAPAALLACVLAALDDPPPSDSSSPEPPPPPPSSSRSSPPPPRLYLLINSLDAPPLRRPATQAALARLAAHPRARALATVDSPHAARLWDAGARARWRCVAHDATTFAPLAAGADADAGGGGGGRGRRPRRRRRRPARPARRGAPAAATASPTCSAACRSARAGCSGCWSRSRSPPGRAPCRRSEGRRRRTGTARSGGASSPCRRASGRRASSTGCCTGARARSSCAAPSSSCARCCASSTTTRWSSPSGTRWAPSGWSCRSGARSSRCCSRSWRSDWAKERCAFGREWFL